MALMSAETHHRPRLLIAEDDCVLAETMREVLEEDFAVGVATDGDEAVARARDEHPDVMVIDARMPRLDGFDTCRALRHDPATADVSIIMVTGGTGPGLASEAF